MKLSKIAATLSFYGILGVERSPDGFRINMSMGRAQRSYLIDTLKWTARTTVGVLLCTALAVGTALLFSNHPWSVFLPIVFVVVIVLIAMRYGVTVGILGSIISAVIFAHLLYEPLYSLQVNDTTERAALAWMILGGIAIPYLVLPGTRSNKK